MESDFKADLERIVGAIDPAHREQTQMQVETLLQAGVKSRTDLISILLDPAAGERRSKACWLLGRLEAEEALPALIATLKDPDPRLRGEAATALGSVGKDSAVGDLSVALRTDPDEHTRLLSALALGLIGAPSAVDALLAALTNHAEQPKVRGAAAEALTGPREIRVVPTLVASLADGAPEVRFWSAFALGELADATVLPALENLANDDAVVPGWWSVKKEAEAAIESIRASVAEKPDP